ncbi:MAG TPA: hypothetical protein VFE47_00335 [Tepidisphaeraceae bacterium]|jgi:hypothetical protein|nr:hypothetical protein [Tepidisphaeraceae bacterium]
MNGLQILDLLSHDEALTTPLSNDEDVVAQFAEKLVANAIDSIKTLRELRPRMFPSTADLKSLEIARALRVEFEKWVQDAEALFAEGMQLRAAGHSIPRLEELGDYSGHTQAMLQVSLESHLRSIEQADRGEVISIEEMRREIQLNGNR